MALTATKLHPLFAAELSGVDLRQALSADDHAAIVAAMDRYGVCVFRETGLTDEQHIAFSRHFGLLEKRPTVGKEQKHLRFRYPELFDAGNVDADGNILPADDRQRSYSQGNRLWHTDSSFRAQRASYSLLLAHVIPPRDADTEFADMRVAYDSLPPDMKEKIENLVAEHWVFYSRALGGFTDPTEEHKKEMPPAHHRLVQIHGGSGRKTLYLATHASHIVGWPVEEGRALLNDLIERATRPEFVYRHTWRVGDLVIWDNRCTMHRATPFEDFEYKRDLRRTTVRDPGYVSMTPA